MNKFGLGLIILLLILVLIHLALASDLIAKAKALESLASSPGSVYYQFPTSYASAAMLILIDSFMIVDMFIIIYFTCKENKSVKKALKILYLFGMIWFYLAMTYLYSYQAQMFGLSVGRSATAFAKDDKICDASKEQCYLSFSYMSTNDYTIILSVIGTLIIILLKKFAYKDKKNKTADSTKNGQQQQNTTFEMIKH